MIMRSRVVKRSVVIAAHKTSVSLEDEFWSGLKEIARIREATLSNIVGELDAQRQHGNLSSAIRLFVLDYYRAAIVARSTDHASAAATLPATGAHQSL
jgi:predicted DNA-binding ribbon-helix-helix protein